MERTCGVIGCLSRVHGHQQLLLQVEESSSVPAMAQLDHAMLPDIFEGVHLQGAAAAFE